MAATKNQYICLVHLSRSAMSSRLWLLGLLWWAHSATAQIRTVGNFPLGVLQPDENASLAHAADYNRAAIEATVEAALRAGRLRPNLAAWAQVRQADWARGWHLSFSQPDTTALHSLRTHGYFRGAYGRKSYVLYLEPAAAFYVLTVVNCGWGSGELGVEGIRPLRPLEAPAELSKSDTKRYLALLFEELVCRNAMALSPEGPVYWKARLTLQPVSRKQCQ